MYDSTYGRETNQKLVATAASLTTSKMKNDSISVVNIHANTTFETIIKDPNQKKFFNFCITALITQTFINYLMPECVTSKRLPADLLTALKQCH